MNLKSSLALSIFALTIINTNAENIITSDTVKVINNSTKVAIIEKGNGVKVEITGTNDDPDYHYVYENLHRSNEIVKTRQREDKIDWNINVPFSKNDSTSYSNNNTHGQ